ncbi:MAG: hypothetical protein J2P56_07945, partial [Verrucomicrobia bacterium]|nr:hypothetical protein [Verrucomicrobiota bacterium]
FYMLLVNGQRCHCALICAGDVTMISGFPWHKVIFPDTGTVRPSYYCGLENCAAQADGMKAFASANRSTACCNARVAARRRSDRSVPLIERDRALELRSTRAQPSRPACHKTPIPKISDA